MGFSSFFFLWSSSFSTALLYLIFFFSFLAPSLLFFRPPLEVLPNKSLCFRASNSEILWLRDHLETKAKTKRREEKRSSIDD